jgi:hypothetical protein
LGRLSRGLQRAGLDIPHEVTDVAQKEMAARMQSPAMVKAMQYVQQSLINELNSRKYAIRSRAGFFWE